MSNQVVNMEEPRMHRYMLAALAVLPPATYLAGVSMSHHWAPVWAILAATAAVGYLSAWCGLELYSVRVLRWFDTPEEFKCWDCGRLVWRVGVRRLHARRRLCVECQQFPGWFQDKHLARIFDPTSLARPRPDYVKGTFH